MKRLRILLAGSPTLLLDSLQHIVAAEPDMAVVGRVGVRASTGAVKRSRADVVVIGRGNKAGEGDEAAYRLVRQLRLKVLSVAGDGKSGTLYELRPQRIPLGELSARRLCKAIRARSDRRNETPS